MMDMDDKGNLIPNPDKINELKSKEIKKAQDKKDYLKYVEKHMKKDL